MAPRKLLIVTALLAIVASVPACASIGELSLANPRMAFDEPGAQITSVYSPIQHFYAVADLNNAPKGTVVSCSWYAVDVEGYEPGVLLDEVTLTIEEDSYSGYISFQYKYEDPSGWPVGKYKAELYLNDVLTHTLNFIVQ